MSSQMAAKMVGIWTDITGPGIIYTIIYYIPHTVEHMTGFL